MQSFGLNQAVICSMCFPKQIAHPRLMLGFFDFLSLSQHGLHQHVTFLSSKKFPVDEVLIISCSRCTSILILPIFILKYIIVLEIS